MIRNQKTKKKQGFCLVGEFLVHKLILRGVRGKTEREHPGSTAKRCSLVCTPRVIEKILHIDLGSTLPDTSFWAKMRPKMRHFDAGWTQKYTTTISKPCSFGRILVRGWKKSGESIWVQLRLTHLFWRKCAKKYPILMPGGPKMRHDNFGILDIWNHFDQRLKNSARRSGFNFAWSIFLSKNALKKALFWSGMHPKKTSQQFGNVSDSEPFLSTTSFLDHFQSLKRGQICIFSGPDFVGAQSCHLGPLFRP